MSVVLIKRSAPACPACMAVQAMLEGEGIAHTTIDITREPEAIEKYDLTSVPVLLIGNKRMEGLVTAEQVRDAIEWGTN